MHVPMLQKKPRQVRVPTAAVTPKHTNKTPFRLARDGPHIQRSSSYFSAHRVTSREGQGKDDGGKLLGFLVLRRPNRNLMISRRRPPTGGGFMSSTSCETDKRDEDEEVYTTHGATNTEVRSRGGGETEEK